MRCQRWRERGAPLYQQRCLDVPQSDEHRPGAVCLQMAEPAGIHHVERAGARVHQPEKVVEGVGVTGATARTPSRSGICSLPTSLSTLKRVPNECCALNLNAGLQGIYACRRIRVAAGSCAGPPSSLTSRRRLRSAQSLSWPRAGSTRQHCRERERERRKSVNSAQFEASLSSAIPRSLSLRRNVTSPSARS